MKFFYKKAAAAVLALSLVLLPLQAHALYATELIPVGDTVGIELSMGGVMIARIGSVKTDNGEKSPAGDAGLLCGDIITRFNSRVTATASDFLTAASGMDGSPVELYVKRGDKDICFTIKPVQSSDGAYQLGLWLRDGVSGIGTVTFYDPASGIYGALGHGINDLESGALLPAAEGNILDAQVVDIVKGESGAPGELCGKYDRSAVLGTLDSNTVCGIFGKAADSLSSGKALPVASSGEIKLGPAIILSNICDNEIKEYSVTISRIYRDGNDLRDIMLTITDPELLSATGGIVQGMSGSPIIQDGKIVGAVTHVLVNDPTRGYGIFIENMLEAAG